MREILPPVEAALKICGKVRPTEGEYRPSMYCLSVPCEAGVLLYHTLTGELLLLSPEEAKQTKPEEKLQRELIRRRFLVPVASDEPAYARQYRQVAQLLTPKKKGITGFTIFTTTDCNARCPYCYELGRPRVPMSERVARDTAAFIARVSGDKEVKISWFGGEPLYNVSAIDIITGELRTRGVPFRSTIVSNGYLFDAETVRRAKAEWATDWVQITLDGREQVYNRTKGFIYRDESAYQRVISNIERLLAADISVAIRLNAGRANMDELSALVDELAVRFKGQNKLTIYSVLLRDFSPARTHPEAETETLQAWDALQHKIITSGHGSVRRLPRSLQTNGCMADNDSCLTILPDGRLGKCEHESEQLLVGSIYDGVTDEAMVARWKERVEVPECQSCPCMPTCIRLRLCSWTGDRCTETDRARIRLSMAQSILNEYQRFLAGDGDKGEKTDETETEFDFSGFGR